MTEEQGKQEFVKVELTPEERKARKEAKKLEKLRKKEEKKRKAEQRRKEEEARKSPKCTWEEIQNGTKQYGEAPLHQSQGVYKPTITDVIECNKTLAEKILTVRARVHRVKGNFVTLRHGMYTLQATAFPSEEVPAKMVKYISKIPIETIVHVTGKLVPANVEAATQSDVELQIQRIYAISVSDKTPLSVLDAMKTEEVLKELAERSKSDKQRDTFKEVSQQVRLDNRVLDLRAPAHVAIFRIQSAIGRLFREYLYSQDFTEIHTPKLLGTASEGGSEVFEVKYFDRKAFLAQSPQLYKQMAVQADFMKVFEIGPVFRAENSHTHRHLTEFVGLDLEMAFKSHYHEVLDLLDEMFVSIFRGIETRFAKELEVINTQYKIDPLKYNANGKNLRLTYPEGMKMLREAGEDIGDFDDLTTPQEKLLGRLVSDKYGTDFYILDKFPMNKRPFYTMPDPENPDYSNSYDLFIRGEEISSGAQRIHDAKLLLEKATEKEVDMAPIQDYVNSFSYGGWPHGGAGIGLERVAMLYLGIPNVRKVSMFPRDPKRLTP